MLVCPWCRHQVTWCASHHWGFAVQPGMTQPLSRALRARRWVGVPVRVSRPRLRMAPLGARRTRWRRASQVNRASRRGLMGPGWLQVGARLVVGGGGVWLWGSGVGVVALVVGWGVGVWLGGVVVCRALWRSL